MRLALYPSAALLLLAAGCGKSEAPPPPSAEKPGPAVTMESSDPAATNTPAPSATSKPAPADRPTPMPAPAPPPAKTQDPVVGKWALAAQGAQMVMDLKPDGRITFDTSTMEAELRKQAGGDPKRLQEVNAALKAMNSVVARWEKFGAIYRLNLGDTADGQTQVGWFRLNGDKLEECDEMGVLKPETRPAVRVK